MQNMSTACSSAEALYFKIARFNTRSIIWLLSQAPAFEHSSQWKAWWCPTCATEKVRVWNIHEKGKDLFNFHFQGLIFVSHIEFSLHFIICWSQRKLELYHSEVISRQWFIADSALRNTGLTHKNAVWAQAYSVYSRYRSRPRRLACVQQ